MKQRPKLFIGEKMLCCCLFFCVHGKIMRLLKYWKNLRKMLLFTRAIRKNASSTLSAASQLIFAHKVALPSYPSEFRFSCKHGI